VRPEGRRARPTRPATRGFIDLHSHVLPRLDDGAATIGDSVELAAALAAAGVRVLAATPHVSDVYPTRAEDIRSGLAEVRVALDAADVAVRLVAGAEIAFAQLEQLPTEVIRSLSLNGTGTFVLIEFPYDGWPQGIADLLAALAREGLFAVLAHPERNPIVQAAPQRLTGLVETGALVQVNAGSVVGASGTAAAEAARSLIDSGLAQLVASDAHDTHSRPTIADAARHLPDELADWLTWEVPSAVLAGERPPPRPSRRGRRWRSW
jgi:protein-tyrosine phosphatase